MSDIYQQQLVCAPILDNKYKHGGKIILPSSALGRISLLNLEYPLMFRIQNKTKFTHAGVIEFTAPEGRLLMPEWMMNDINVTTGSRVDIHTCSLPRATYVKFQPQSVDFLEITDPKAALEYHLRSFACLTCNSHLLMKYGAKDYYLKVLEIKPVSQYKAVSIIETDFVVDFEAPVGYVEPQRVVKEPEYVSQDGDLDPSQIHDEDDSEEEKPKFTVFSGSGVRISGKKVDEPASVVNNLAKSTKNEVKKPFLNSKGELVYLVSNIYLIPQTKMTMFTMFMAIRTFRW
eukprot:TRINITY_DN2254_c0_g1_i3.p1 TRINITY_DN2254_c0_g1~~TRINITY_DN2254_c0_g1_i3.p1  ORF type:complete len:288 (-),score=38.96 TRINITY_DN2254_c0_g1_i3:257-1120(-)